MDPSPHTPEAPTKTDQEGGRKTRAGTKLYIQLFPIDRKKSGRCVVLRKSFLQHLYVVWVLRLPDEGSDDIIRKMEITFQFQFTIDEASSHLDFYVDSPTFSFPDEKDFPFFIHCIPFSSLSCKCTHT
jgi:hypothetical protein